MIGEHLVGECFARLLRRELRDRGDNCVVRGDIRTKRRSAKEAFSQNLTSYTVSFSWVSTMCSGTQSHTEMRGLRVLCKTLMRRSWLQVRLHFEIIDWAMLGTPFPKVSSWEVHIVTMELPILINCPLQWSWKLRSQKLGILLRVCFFNEERTTEQKPDDIFNYVVPAEFRRFTTPVSRGKNLLNSFWLATTTT